MATELVYFPYAGNASLTATITLRGSGDIIETATAVAPTTFNLGGTTTWQAATFSGANFGPFALHVFDGATEIATYDIGMLGPRALATPIQNTGNINAFEQVLVDHLFFGETRVWWRLASDFHDAGPYVYKLQASYGAHQNAIDWVDVSVPHSEINFIPYVNMRERTGKNMLTHYRVMLYTPTGTYLSNPTPVWGNLNSIDFKYAQELTRKERIRLRSVSVPGYLLRRLRYGTISTVGTDLLTREVVRTDISTTWGTPFDIGYHPPIPMDIDPTYGPNTENRGGGDIQTNNTLIRQMNARVLAQPDVAFEDVWVNAQTDERWLIQVVKPVAAVRGIPIVRELAMNLIPRTHVIYKIPVDGFSLNTRTTDEESTAQVGDGCNPVNHDFPTTGAMLYTADDCCGISGATVTIYTQTDYSAENTGADFVVASTTTTTGGQWTETVNLSEGEYVVVFEKPGFFGPDTQTITVTDPPDPDAGETIGEFTSTFEF